MLHSAVVFFVIAMAAALLGFGGVAAGAGSIANVLFVFFAASAVASYVHGLLRQP